MHRGWVRLYRKLQDNPFWTSEKFTRGQAWVDLILIANHKDGHIRVRGVMLEVLRGQVAHAEKTLAVRWSWSRGKVRKFISELQIASMIEHQKNNVMNLITIINYDEHQINSTPDSTTDRTTERQQTEQQTDTNNKDKKDKNEKIYYTEIEGLVLPLKEKEYFLKEFAAKDVEGELVKMSQWLYSNPAKRKKNYRSFISKWLVKAEEKVKVQDWSTGNSDEIRREQEKLGRSDNTQ